MKQTLISHSSPVTAQPSRKRRRLSSKSLYKSPVFSLKVNRLPNLLVNKKKPSRECVVQSYPEFKDLLNKYVTTNAAPVSFNVSHSLDRVDYGEIVYDLSFSNLRSGGRDKIKNPRPGYCEYPIVCSSVKVMKAAYNLFGHHWKVIMRSRPDYGDCKKAKLLAEMHKFRLKAKIDIHSPPQSSRKKRRKTKTRVNVSSYDEFKHLLGVYVPDNAELVSFNVSNYVDTKSYGCITKDLLDSNSKWNRRDKIKHPRSDHFPPPVVSCETTENMRNVYDAIGPYWRVIMCVCEHDNPKLFHQMDDYRMTAGIEDDEKDPL